MITTEQFYKPCGCRSVGECNHNLTVEAEALEAAVDAFAVKMKEKLLRKMFRDGYSGWDNKEHCAAIHSSLRQHMEKGDMIDIANLAMMLWNFEN